MLSDFCCIRYGDCRTVSIIIIIITKEYDYGGVMSEDCNDTLQTK